MDVNSVPGPFVNSVAKIALLACAGVAGEVAFDALSERRDLRLSGRSYAWMFPVYAVLYPGYALLFPLIDAWPWAVRGLLYGVLILAGELVFGLLLRAALGQAPWEPQYRGKPRVVAGLCRLDYLPAWAAGGLVFERFFLLLARS